ncbi:amidase [Marinibaculum pumilum]|uniref:Amidase n=1 Tax=Marinibaculum pumilum TaxID=1766165 RepID=A0ABV7L592_9PROT
MSDINRMTAVEIAAKVRSKDLSPSEVVEASLKRMEATEPHLKAFCHAAPELARSTAKALEAKLAAGEEVGPLAGVPVGIKDLVATKDLPTVQGSMVYKDFTPDEDDICVERLKAAGAIIVGKTNVPEFGYSGVGHNPVFPTTRNPWNLERTPGGSSAGSGASVAAGVTPFAIGSDGGGSVRIPSAHCGLVGVKASMGRVPLYPGCRDERFPGISSWESIEHIGPMSRSVADSAAMLAVITGPDMRDRLSIPCGDVDWMGAVEKGRDGIKGLKVAYSADWGYAPVDPDVRRIVGEAVKVFESDLGCTVEEANPGWDDPYNDFWALVASNSDLAGMRAWLPDHAHHMSPHLVDFLMRPWTAEDLTNSHRTRQAVCNRMWRLMQNYDLLLTPTLAVPPFPLLTQGPEKIDGQIVHPVKWLAFTFPMNMTGQPAATVPAGWTTDSEFGAGLPVGLQIVGRHLGDETVLKAAAAFEAARPWADKWPALLDKL